MYTSPLTVLSYFVLYLLHEFRMALLWIVSQQYLLLVLPAIAAAIYFVYQTDGAHQPVRMRTLSFLQGPWNMDDRDLKQAYSPGSMFVICHLLLQTIALEARRVRVDLVWILDIAWSCIVDWTGNWTAHVHLVPGTPYCRSDPGCVQVWKHRF